MNTIKITVILLGVALGFGCGSQRGIDLTKRQAADSIKRVYGYPREVYVSIASSGSHHPFGERDIQVYTPKSKGADMRQSRGTREAILNHAIRKGWLTLDFHETGNTDYQGKPVLRFMIRVTPEGEGMWQQQGETWVARFGTSRFKGITGIHGAVGAATYEVTYGDEIEVLRIWRGAGGQALADDRLTGELTTTLYRYADGWRVHVN